VLSCAGLLAWAALHPGSLPGRRDDAPGRPPADERPGETVVEWGKEAQVGDVFVGVASAYIQPVTGFGPAGEYIMTRERHLNITLTVRNASPARLADVSGSAGSAGLRDDLGNGYSEITIRTEGGARARLPGQLGRVRLYSDRPARDQLVFERPASAVTRST
jgi:hypothetical protein